MSEIKRPEWERQGGNPFIHGYGPDTTISSDSHIDVDMLVFAKHKSDSVMIKITKVENGCDAEGIILSIIPKTEGRPKTDLSSGDRVFINILDIEVLLR